ncbi:MAG TPA: radical SAM family heme chaperone HemW [Verrucomicrobiae bacterium]|jgi:oxygen-independent coproporphyrinogen-3 oxidase|nr:radical SAM family heme chaperone HemW [Verrucomicrobiae bacterium]
MLDEPIIEHLYVHVPFCARKCAYCAFYSEAGDAALIQRYAEALVREMELVAADLKPRTIFFGGGTPSLLNLRQWEMIFQAMDRLHLLGAAEWTIECNPATVSLDKARLFRQFGVNRISMGAQSFDETLLEKLGRVHSRDMIYRSFDTLRAAGFDNINIDLMFAIPGQTLDVWRQSLRDALALGTEHLSCYEVIYEEDTALYEDLQAGRVEVNEDLACAMYEELLGAMESGGFAQYEVANFARGSTLDTGEIPARACRHNINYWRGGSYYGVGPSAAEYVRGARAKNWSNTVLWCEQLEKGRRAVESTERLEPLARAGELAAFGLRMNAGWPLDKFQARTGFDLRREWRGEIKKLIDLGYGCFEGGRFHLTRTGMRYADWAAEEFLKV